MYGQAGACQVTEIGPLPGGRPDRRYYTLRPVDGAGVIYVPVDTQVWMEPVFSRQEAESLLGRAPAIGAWSPGAPGRLQQQEAQYRALFRRHSREALVGMLKTVERKRSQGRGRLGSVDDRYGRLAEKILSSELSVALALPLEEARRRLLLSVGGSPRTT